MFTIRNQGDNKDIKIRSIIHENPKLMRRVLLPQGDFINNEIKETNYYTYITVPGCEIEIKIVGTENDDNNNIFYKNYKINNLTFSSEKNPTTTMCFETNINDVYKIEIISEEKTNGNMIHPGKIIKKIYNINYKFNSEENISDLSSVISIFKADFTSDININQNSDDDEEEEEELEEDDENGNDEDDDESD